MPRAAMTPVSRKLSQAYGDPQFWDYFRTAIEQKHGTRHFTFSDWEAVLEKARECGLLDVAGTEQTPVFASPWGMAFLRLWRAIQSAKSRGMSERQFYREYDATLEIERAETAIRVREYDQQRATQFAQSKPQKGVMLPTATEDL